MLYAIYYILYYTSARTKLGTSGGWEGWGDVRLRPGADPGNIAK